MLVGLIRLGVSITGSLAGVLATAVLWKPGVVIGALLVSVITVFVDQTFGEPLLRLAHRAPTNRPTRGGSLRVALVVGLAGSLCLGAALTVPKLVEGDPLKATPLFGGQVPLVESDSDGDGIADADDNCPAVANPGQEDTNGAGRGDACDPDDDNDTVADADDNCPAIENAGQEDADGDGLGDACDDDAVVTDTDTDEDGIPDAEDNCPDVANPLQEDTNGAGTRGRLRPRRRQRRDPGRGRGS